MDDTQTATGLTDSTTQNEVEHLVDDLNSTAAVIQSFIDHRENVPISSIRSLPSILRQAREVEQRLIMQYHIAQILADSKSINKAAALVLETICQTTGWEYGALWRLDPNTQTLNNEGVWYPETLDLSDYAEAVRYSALKVDHNSLPGQVILSGQPVWVNDLDPLELPDVLEMRRAGLQSAILLPVPSRDGTSAVLECVSNHVQAQDQTLMEMMYAICNQIGVFLERKQLEEALSIYASQQQLLAQAGIALSASLDYRQRLDTIAHLMVPDLADWCAIDLILPGNILERVAAVHVDQAKLDRVFTLQPTHPVDINQVSSPQAEILLTGKSLLFTDISMDLLEKNSTSPAQLAILRELAPKSSIVVPLIANKRVLGICSLVYSDSGRHYLPDDLPLAEDIMHRVALSLANAFIYAESQKLNTELEQRVDERTAQLKLAINQLTNQITERQRAEDQVKILNLELEQRIAERTFQLEIANRDLHKEVLDHQKASESLRTTLKRTRELYAISQAIGTVRTPDEVLKVLLKSSYLEDVSRGSIAILEKPWIDHEAPPESCFILAEWNRGARLPKFIHQRFTLEEYGISLPIPFGKPILIPDIQSEDRLPALVRKRFADLRTHSLIILPLVAGGEWYGLLSLHFKTRRMTNLDELRHVRGLVDETAIAIKNMRLLEAESQARHEAEESNKIKLKFLAMISHELRTPLTSIKGFATTLLAEDVTWDADKQRDFIQTINVESDKLGDLIEQLLDLSRMEAGILRISPKRLLLNEVITSALAQLQAVTADHRLVVNVSSDLPPIYGDMLRIAQVLTNLVNNAAKYSPAHTQITISSRKKRGMVQVDVADKGSGIPLQERTHVFEAFRQLNDSSGNLARGAGLGLAICKGLVEAQGGKIWIQDRPGPGTTVSFTLPIYEK